MKQEINPAYVSFEQAEWLKEKNWLQRTKMVWLYSLGKQHLREVHLSLELNNAEYNAPEQWQVAEWLRVNHGIWVFLERGLEPVNFYPVIDINHKVTSFKYHPPMWYNSPQEAYSAAFDYIKDNNLI